MFSEGCSRFYPTDLMADAEQVPQAVTVEVVQQVVNPPQAVAPAVAPAVFQLSPQQLSQRWRRNNFSLVKSRMSYVKFSPSFSLFGALARFVAQTS